MKETRIPKLSVNPIGKRLERIVAEKKDTNEKTLGKIKSLTDSWEELHKTLETDIKDEFETMDLEEQALEEAIGDLEKNRTKPIRDAFTIAGKVRSEQEKVGLPNVTVVILQRIGEKNIPLVKAVGEKNGILAKGFTDNLGNFVFRLGVDIIGGDDQAKLEVEHQVLAGDSTLLHSEVQSLTPRLGGITQVMLEVEETDVVSDQLEAGKAVKDSILDSRSLIASRVKNMRSAHDALAKMSAIARDDLNAMHEALAVTPPDFKSIIVPSKAGDDHPEPEPDQTVQSKPLVDIKIDKPKAKDTRQIQTRPLPIEKESIKGIGPRRVEILKKANIEDVETFVKTDKKTLTELLGNLDFKTMKKEASALLKKR